MLGSVTNWQSLLYCARAEVTVERIRSLAAEIGTEPLTVDFKQSWTPRIAECAAAMANTYGGLIIVGITDKEREFVGVSREAIAHVVDGLAARLAVQSWTPDTFEVKLDDSSEKYLVVVRIDQATSPRPVFVEMTGRDRQNFLYAPVRTHGGGTRSATRDELYALFTENRPVESAEDAWDLNRPEIPFKRDGGRDNEVDFVLFSGLRLSVVSTAWGRPISSRAVNSLAKALDRSPLTSVLYSLTGTGQMGVDEFRREGLNRSNVANLAWRLRPGGQPNPFEMNLYVEVPGHYGQSAIDHLLMTLKVVSRRSAWQRTGRPAGPPPPHGQYRRFEVDELRLLLDALVDTLTSPQVVEPIADIAGIEPLMVRQPRVVHFVSGPPAAELLPPQLMAIRDGGESHGAHMLSYPELDLSDSSDRREQCLSWIRQMSADAGLLGMDELVDQLVHEASVSEPAK